MGVVFWGLGGCNGDRTGQTCTDDEQCGAGYDCYQERCVAVCTADAQCRTGQQCYRFRCLEAGVTPPPRISRPPVGKANNAAPQAPDATLVELRALRREVEILRRDQQRIIAILEGKSAAEEPAQAPATSRPPRVVMPPPTSPPPRSAPAPKNDTP